MSSTTSAASSLAHQSATSPRERVTCGWCNRFVSGHPDGQVRHVTCDDCRALVALTRPALVKAAGRG